MKEFDSDLWQQCPCGGLVFSPNSHVDGVNLQSYLLISVRRRNSTTIMQNLIAEGLLPSLDFSI